MSNKIKVVCRVRPFLAKETKDETVTVETGTQLRVTNPRDSTKDVRFSFDACYGAGSQQQTIYGNDVRPLVETVFTGMSATVFCYGVTGAGKTYTMEGSENDPGIIPRALAHVFKRKERDAYDYDVRVSYYEIYKEAVFDLFARPADSGASSVSGSGLPIREDANRRIFVAGLSERRVHTYEQFEAAFAKASGRRRTASTKLNDQSSRSHAILTVSVQWTDDIGPKGKMWCGKLHLIDLAGSEDNRRTENGRDRMAESSAINRSLFVLGQVVEALNTGAARVPYRDSKMTRILQDSLGGECLGMMIVNVAPGLSLLHDTHNTLSFATRSREVVNRPVAHEVVEHRWSAADRLQHHRAANATRGVRTQVVASTDGAKRRRSHADENSDENAEADTGRRSLGSLGEAASKKRKVSAPARHSTGTAAAAAPAAAKQEPKARDNEIMQRVMRIEKQLSSSRLDSNMVIDMFTPTTKLKTSRGWLKHAREIEARGDLDKALLHYEEALRYAPELNKLETHIARLRARIRRRNRRSSIESYGNAAWTVTDGNGNGQKPVDAKEGDEEDLGPLWMPDGLAESPGADKAKRRAAAASKKDALPKNQPKNQPKSQVKNLPKSQPKAQSNEKDMQPEKKQGEQKRIKLQAIANNNVKPQHRALSKVTEGSVHDQRRISFGTGANNPFVVGGDEFNADLQERLDRKTQGQSLRTDRILAKSSAAARLQKRLAVPPTPDDRSRDTDYVPPASSDDSDNDIADMANGKQATNGARKSQQQQRRMPGALGVRGLLEQRMMAQTKENVDASGPKSGRVSDVSAGSKSRRGSGSNAAGAEEKLELGRFNDICLASALQMINSAEVKKITKLQGIGKRRAEQIRASIQAEGPLKHISELQGRLQFKNKIILDILSTFA
ncbi:hypothetical protein EV175_000122 [Coemansia sp. RSA 1933]|nr:hypothetical protein EV175_000122 [Coemansia sp. RSA 1933]